MITRRSKTHARALVQAAWNTVLEWRPRPGYHENQRIVMEVFEVIGVAEPGSGFSSTPRLPRRRRLRISP
jgi:hypothetical protein